MKLLAFYLPQFHEIPENNDAWGNGFTEWTNTKKSRPLYKGHYQPREPLNDNYYNLLDPKVMEWQSNLALSYGLSGFVYYHYWFDGKKLLEKPIEQMLKNQKVKIPFCFAWANSAWTKTWHGAGGKNEILIRQTYGNQESWEKHYEYFRPFFKDKRYILVNNRPMLLIYRMKEVRKRDQMFKLWNQLAREDGFDGIFIVDMLAFRETVNSKYVNATVDYEPGKALFRGQNDNLWQMVKRYSKLILQSRRDDYGLFNKIIANKYDYDLMNKRTLNKPHRLNEFRGICVGYDDSPRQKLRASIVTGVTPQKFQKYLYQIIEKSKTENNEFIFINAWNEWGESAYMEPDKKNGYQYLEAMKCALKEAAVYDTSLL